MVWELTIHMLVIMIWDSVLVIWDLGMEMGGYAMPAPQGNEMGMNVVDAMWNVDGAVQQA